MFLTHRCHRFCIIDINNNKFKFKLNINYFKFLNFGKFYNQQHKNWLHYNCIHKTKITL